MRSYGDYESEDEHEDDGDCGWKATAMEKNLGSADWNTSFAVDSGDVLLTDQS